MRPPARVPDHVLVAGDVLLAAALTALSVAVHLGGSEAVAANHDPSLFSVLLTIAATAPLAVRRRAPVTVLAVTLVALLLMVATRNTVGLSTLGPTIAFYTAVAHGTGKQVRSAVLLVLGGLVVGALLRPVDLSVEGAIVNTVVLVGAWVLATGVRQRREGYEAEVRAAQERAALSAAEERLRITRELHDIVGHALGVMVVQAGVADQLLSSRPEEARTAIAEIGDTGRASLAEMRQVLGALRDGTTEPGPPRRQPLPTLASVPALLARVESAGLAVDLVLNGQPRTLPAGLDLAAYRIVQEALTNCLKHAHATRATVTLDHLPDAVAVTVVDDGRTLQSGSADAENGPPGHGHGLVGMRERVAVFGGELSASPRTEGGFRVHAVLPIPVGNRA